MSAASGTAVPTAGRGRRCLLHIGTHKTGTTAIQDLCWRNADALRAAGLCYPLEFLLLERYHLGQHCIAWQLMGQGAEVRPFPPGMDDPLTLLRERLEALHDDVLLSSENFCRLDPAAVERLAGLLTAWSVEVVVYLRRQDEFLQSLYQTAVLHSGYESDIHALGRSVEMDYHALLSRWAAVFGRAHVHARVFDRRCLHEGDVGSDFIQLLAQLGFAPGVDASTFVRSGKRLNRGYPRAFVECLRWLRAHQPLPGTEALMLQPADAVYAGSAVEFGYLDAVQAQALLVRHEASNQRVAREYFGRDTLFPAPELPIGGGDTATDDVRSDLQRLLKDVVGHVCARREATH